MPWDTLRCLTPHEVGYPAQGKERSDESVGARRACSPILLSSLTIFMACNSAGLRNSRPVCRICLGFQIFFCPLVPADRGGLQPPGETTLPPLKKEEEEAARWSKPFPAGWSWPVAWQAGSCMDTAGDSRMLNRPRLLPCHKVSGVSDHRGPRRYAAYTQRVRPCTEHQASLPKPACRLLT